MKKKNLLYIITPIIIICDQISKLIVKTNIKLNNTITIIPHFFSLTYVHNDGIAWSMLEGQTILIILVSLIIILSLIIYLHKNKDMLKYEKIAYLMIIGGSLSNLYDRFIYGYVIDFLDFNLFGYNYPIFNLADSFIVIGLFVLIIGMWRKKDENRSIRG